MTQSPLLYAAYVLHDSITSTIRCLCVTWLNHLYYTLPMCYMTQSPAFHVLISDRSCWDRSMERRQRSISVGRSQISARSIWDRYMESP